MHLSSKYTQNLITSYYLQRYRYSLNHHQLLPALTILTGLFVSTPHFHLLSFISFSMLTAKVMLLEKVKPFQYILKILDHFSLSFVPSVWKGHVMSFNFLSLYSNITYCHPHLNSGKKKISQLSGFLLPKSIFYNTYHIPIHGLHSMLWHPNTLS